MPETSGFSDILREKAPVPKVLNGPLKTVLASDELFLKNSLPNVKDGKVLKTVASSFNVRCLVYASLVSFNNSTLSSSVNSKSI